MTEPTNSELITRVQHGDPAATAELFTRFWRAARATAFGVTGDWANAEDAASEAFCQALTGIGTLHDPSAFPGWLRTIVIRKAGAAVPPPPEAAVDPADQQDRPDQILLRYERQEALHQAVRQLPEKLREAIALVYFEGYSHDAAAQFLGVPAGTLRRRLHDARKRLETLLANGHPPPATRTQLHGDLYQTMRQFLLHRPTARNWAKLFGAKLPAMPIPSVPPHPNTQLIRQALTQFPEFAPGHPHSEIRVTTGLLRGHETIFEHLKQSPNKDEFLAAAGQIRLVEVIDLTWMEPDSLELRTVQELLVRLAAALLPGINRNFSTYAEPRYRSALQLHLGDKTARAALGGVLNHWPARPQGMEAAHIRIFPEEWRLLGL
ncbi:MAG: sigma-70 family RNA polymerase sigma factor [Bryobacterales bacterium]|nr:sigma-70 family RNA polymerase sigma factor [Bryobacterales bacterium]